VDTSLNKILNSIKTMMDKINREVFVLRLMEIKKEYLKENK
jgi:hypothetical protein